MLISGEMKGLDVFEMVGTLVIDWDGPAPDGNLDDATPVEVPNTRNPLEPAQNSSLTNLINPLCNSDEYGIDIYLETLTFIQEVAISIQRFT